MNLRLDIKKKVFFKTFGCRTNIYDTQVMINSLRDFDVADNEKDADIIIVNSCTVTNGADSNVRSYISKHNSNNKKIILAGCWLLNDGSKLFKGKKIFGAIGHSEKENINDFLFKKEPFIELGNINSVDKNILNDYVGKCKAYIKIQEGCNFKCAYCIIPNVRGDSRSQDEDKILKQIDVLASNGFSEFVLTGTNIGSYGRDKNSSLGNLLKKISKINGVKRVRLGSIEPIQIDDSFREILKENWLEKHLHIALQHTNEEMLKIMHRRNSVKRDSELFSELSELGFALGTDFIVGHPGETNDIWIDAERNLRKLPLTHIHTFCYSAREGTLSASMEQNVSGDIAKNRLKKIYDIVELKNIEFRKNNMIKLDVLIESKKNNLYTGYDQFYNRVFIKSDVNLIKQWIAVDKYEVKKEGNYAII